MRLICCVIGLYCTNLVFAQTPPPYPTPVSAPLLTRFEYFVDQDPGFGSGTRVLIDPAALDLNGFIDNLTIAGGLPRGIHQFFLRSQDESGHWSLTHSVIFENLNPAYPTPLPSPDIVELETFIDTDPGFGNGSPIDVTDAQNIPSLTSQIDISTASPGIHQLFIRSKDALNRWSITNSGIWENLNPQYPTSPAVSQGIKKLEYFVNTDPGFGSGITLNRTPSPNVNSLVVIANVSGASPVGNHNLGMRSQDVEGRWSLTNFGQFNNTIFVYPQVPLPAGSIIEIEYFFDQDPGFRNGTKVSITPASNISNLIFETDITDLPDGPHTLYIRSLAGPWSITNSVDFEKQPILPVSLVDFQGVSIDGIVELRWSTLTELNNSHFEIERMDDEAGLTFSTIGRREGHGTSKDKHYYMFHDRAPRGLREYYRLKQVDWDGHYIYSSVIAVSIPSGEETGIDLYPNPVEQSLTVNYRFRAGKDKTAIYITDMLGRRFQIPCTIGASSANCNTSSLKSGIYILHLSEGDRSQTVRFVVK
jgi:hypothetical protein